MLRLVGFFVLSLLLATLLGHVPVIGPLFRHSGILGVFLAAALLSFTLSRLGERLVTARKLKAEIRALGVLDSPHHRGKLGALLLSRGRARAAREHLVAAIEGEPDSVEWRYRLGLAELACGALEPALAAFEACVSRDEEYAYGQAQLRRAECLLRLGRAEQALVALERHARNHGETPEGLYRRGRALAALGRKDEARTVLERVGALAAKSTRYQRAEARSWALRARLARLF